VNKTLTFLFDDDTRFESHHYAFHVSNREFDTILQRVKAANIVFGSAPWSLDDGSSTIGAAVAASIFAIPTATFSSS
jgi:hypothetical protein